MRAKELKAGALMIHAEPSAEGFYKRMGATGSAKGHFIILQSLYCLICSTSFLVDGSHVEDALLRYRLGCAARRGALPPERFRCYGLRGEAMAPSSRQPKRWSAPWRSRMT